MKAREARSKAIEDNEVRLKGRMADADERLARQDRAKRIQMAQEAE